MGKTWLIRELAQDCGRDLVELNLEHAPRDDRFFASNEPTQILAELSLALDRELSVHRSLLFLDEIQAVPELLPKLRWFAE